jgi:glucosyl-3-phosphoglycerate synthase
MMIVKAAYHRPTDAGGGGRTTELVARPLISRCFPSLAGLEQPLSGEYAVRRAALEQLSFVQGWGVEMGLLIDIERRWGADAIGQVDLGRRVHRHRSLQSLSVQAAEVMATMLDRAGVPAALASAESEQVLERPDGSVVPLNLSTRPPVASLRHAKRA